MKYIFLLIILLVIPVSSFEYTGNEMLCVYDIYYNESCLYQNQTYNMSDSQDYFIKILYYNQTNSSFVHHADNVNNSNINILFITFILLFILFFVYLTCVAIVRM